MTNSGPHIQTLDNHTELYIIYIWSLDVIGIQLSCAVKGSRLIQALDGLKTLQSKKSKNKQ